MNISASKLWAHTPGTLTHDPHGFRNPWYSLVEGKNKNGESAVKGNENRNTTSTPGKTGLEMTMMIMVPNNASSHII